MKFDEEFAIQLDPHAMDNRLSQNEPFHPIKIDKVNRALEQGGEFPFHGQESHPIEGSLSRHGYIHIARGIESPRRRRPIDKDEPESVSPDEIISNYAYCLIGVLPGHD
jgi:hypothetical protein